MPAARWLPAPALCLVSQLRLASPPLPLFVVLFSFPRLVRCLRSSSPRSSSRPTPPRPSPLPSAGCLSLWVCVCVRLCCPAPSACKQYSDQPGKNSPLQTPSSFFGQRVKAGRTTLAPSGSAPRGISLFTVEEFPTGVYESTCSRAKSFARFFSKHSSFSLVLGLYLVLIRRF